MLSAPTYTNRWNPFQELATLHRDMDRVFGRQLGDAAPASNGNGAWTPPCEIAPLDDGWRVCLALPSVDPNQVQITLHGNTLRINGERPRPGEGDKYTHSELSYGPFERTFTLPAPADGDSIEAHFQHGMLTVTVPVAESAKPRQIRIGGPGIQSIDTRKLA